MNTPSVPPPSIQILGRVRQASGLLVQRKPAEAVGILSAVVDAHPRFVEARRLLAVALRELGDLPGAEFQLREALTMEVRADLLEALAATLEAGGLRAEAERIYRQALALDPLFPRTAIGLSELLLNENRLEEALEVIAPLGTRADADIHVLSAYGLALKALRRFDEAVEAYGQAARTNPRSAVAEHNLGAALGDGERFQEAEAALRRAFAKGLDAPQTWMALGRALQGQDRFDEAETAYRQALARRPGDAAAHAELAQLTWMRSGDAARAGAALDGAIAAYPADSGLRSAKSRLLEYAGDREGAYRVLVGGLSVREADPALHIQASHLAAWFDPECALGHAERALALKPDALDALSALCLANLAVGRPDQAARLAGTLRERAPFDQQAVAIQATAWRLLDDPRYRELQDHETLVRGWAIDTPAGWSDPQAFLDELAIRLNGKHALRTHPIGQSLRSGTQTQQRLDRSDDPVIRAFFQAIDGPIRRHLEALGAGPDPVRSRNTGGYRIEGAWSARLRPDGYHADHLHARGWLSSACHIALPKAVENGREGWLRFGRPGVPTRPALAAEAFIKPEPGRLVLFPSYMWHGTEPFSGDEARLAIAFDLLPA
ncbi:MAG TPA: tetratricopeptide repeat protein [Caulobacteraceae bacterium]|nr:tetratricopeptide repeat protein [Caulobacteraceae bacterium]